MPQIAAKEQEVLLTPQDLIISKTCPKGKIRYANRTFMEISGFSEQALLGQPHNLIRHPDMPKGVFRLMWKTLQQGEEFFGFVKNLCIDGSYYWVFANITRDLSIDGTLQGYYSVRRAPPAHAIKNTIIPLYREMLSIEQASSAPAALDQSVEALKTWVADTGMDYNHAMITLYQQNEHIEGRESSYDGQK